ncbi:MAG: cytochrome P450 [Actinobacteria bacterium]|nr:MAG: cytochrome P450 [Actinomycetota bacterium]
MDDRPVTQPDTVSLIELMKEPAIRADPYPTYSRLQAMGPVLPTVLGGWLLTRHADVFAVLRDARFSSSSRHQGGYDQLVEMARQLGLSDLQDLMGRVMLFADPPDHTRLRRIVGQAFTGRAVEERRHRIAAIVDRMLDSMASDGGADLVEGLAFPLPVTVISDMLGVPETDHEMLRAWTAEAVKALDPSDDMTVFFPAADAIRSLRTYFDELVSHRRHAPGADLLSALITAEDHGDRLTHEELLDTAVLLFGAGHETTVNLISGGTLNLLRHPDELARLRADPGLVTTVVEELLRFGPPVQMTARIATTDVELAGQRIARGTEVVALIAAANRDPDVFEDPGRLDVGRRDNRHLSFGGGIHHCLGAPLARIEGQEAIGRLVTRFPDLDLAEPDIEWKPTSTIRGPKSLALAW